MFPFSEEAFNMMLIRKIRKGQNLPHSPCVFVGLRFHYFIKLDTDVINERR